MSKVSDQKMLSAGDVLLRARFDDLEQMCADVRAWDLDFQPLADPARSGPVADLLQMRFEGLDESLADVLDFVGFSESTQSIANRNVDIVILPGRVQRRVAHVGDFLVEPRRKESAYK